MCIGCVRCLDVIAFAGRCVAVGLGSLDGVLRAGAIRSAPCRFLNDLIHLGVRGTRVR